MDEPDWIQINPVRLGNVPSSVGRRMFEILEEHHCDSPPAPAGQVEKSSSGPINKAGKKKLFTWISLSLSEGPNVNLSICSGIFISFQKY